MSQPSKWQESQSSYRRRIPQDALGKVNRVKEIRRRGNVLRNASVYEVLKYVVCMRESLSQRRGGAVALPVFCVASS